MNQENNDMKSDKDYVLTPEFNELLFNEFIPQLNQIPVDYFSQPSKQEEKPKILRFNSTPPSYNRGHVESPTLKRRALKKRDMIDQKQQKFNLHDLEPQGFGLWGAVKSVKETIDTVKETASSVDVEEVNRLMKAINDSGAINPATVDAVGLLMKATNYATQVKNDVTSSVMWKYKIEIILHIFGLWCLNKYNRTDDKVYLFCGFVALAYATYSVTGKLVDFATEIARPESMSEDIESITKGLFVMFLGSGGPYVLPKEILHGVSCFPRYSDGVESIVNCVKSMAQKVYDFVLVHIMEKETEPLFASKFPEVEDAINEALEIERLHNSGQLQPSVDSIRRVQLCLDKITKIFHETPRNPKTSGVTNDMFSMMNKLRKRIDYLHMMTSSKNGIRVEPVGIWLKGVPGTFKSLQALLFGHWLMANTLPKEDLVRFLQDPTIYTYYRRMGEVFWDTYTDDKQITVMDDFGQAVDTDNTESSEFLDWIRAINMAPYPLNMAAVDNKGKAFFHSKFVIATTNLKHIRPNSIIDAQAVKRRIDFLVKVSAKEGYADPSGAFDKELLPRVDVTSGVTTQVSLDMFNYTLVDWDDKPISKTMDFSEFSALVLEKHKEKKMHHESLLKEVQKINKQATSRLGVPQSSISEFEPRIRFSRPKKSKFRAVCKYEQRVAEILCTHKMEDIREVLKSCVQADPHIRFTDVHGTAQMFLYRYGEAFNDLFCDDGTIDVDKYESFLYDVEHELYADPFDIEDDAKSIYNRWKDWNTQAYNWISDNYPILAYMIDLSSQMTHIQCAVALASLFIAATGVKTILEGLYSWFDSVFGTKYFLIVPESVHKQTDNVKIERNVQNVKMRAHPQLGADPNGQSIVESIMASNGYELWWVREGKEERMGYALAVVDRVFLMPAHFIFHIAAYSKIMEVTIRFQRRSKGKPVVYEFNSSVFLDGVAEHEPSLANDLIAVKLPRSCVGQHRDIRSYFCKENTVARMYGQMDITVNFPRFDVKHTAHVVGKFEYDCTVGDIDGSKYSIRKVVAYTGLNSKKGDCGSIVSWANPKLQKEKFFGMHVAGSNSADVGFAGVIYQEMLYELTEPLVLIRTIEDFKIPDATCESGFEIIETGVRTPRLPTRTQFTKSVLFGLHEEAVQEAPAAIDKLFVEKCYLNMTNKYCERVQGHISYETEAKDFLEFLRNNSPNHCKPTIYTFEMAVIGDEEALRSIDRSTSSGWPFNLERGSSKKSYFFGKAQKHDLECANAVKLKEDCIWYAKQLDLGIRVPQNYTDFPKDELVKLSKVISRRIRLISACTTVLLVTIRMYFGAFMSWIARNCVLNGSAIGLDPYSEDWDLLAKSLHKIGTTVNAGDYSDYDANHVTTCMWAVLEMINEWYNDEFAHIRRGLFEELVSSRHVFMGCIVQWNGCMPPGNPLTSIINTMCNHLYIRKCYSLIIKRRDFDVHVFLVCQGDDNIWSVSDERKEVFNEYTIKEPMERQGLLYTLENKTENDSYKPRTLFECEFLKRTFREHEHLKRIVGPLRLSKTLSLCNWTSNNDMTILLDKLDVMSMELALAGEQTWNKYMSKTIYHWDNVRGRYGRPRLTLYEYALDRLRS